MDRFDWFLVFWLGMWVVGWVFAATTLVGQLGGAETVRVANGDLVISSGAGPLRRTWRYRGSAIANMTSYDPAPIPVWGRNQMQRPFFLRPSAGAVKFDYGADTVFLATGVDEPEGRAIVAWIARRLPACAAQSG